MEAGDSLLLDGEGPHGPLELQELPLRFLAVPARDLFTRRQSPHRWCIAPKA
jgi:hypothetical protein